MILFDGGSIGRFPSVHKEFLLTVGAINLLSTLCHLFGR